MDDTQWLEALTTKRLNREEKEAPPPSGPSMQFLKTALDAVWQAGDMVKSRLGTLGTADVFFKSEIDPVTEIDRASEKMIVELIRRRHPNHDFVAEEGTVRQNGSRYRWLIDPLDGTVNFAHSLPWFSVSAALQVDGVTEVGAVYLPVSDELFAASRGRGATLNGHSIHVSERDLLSEALLATGFPYNVRERCDEVLTYLGRFLRQAQGVRRVGSAAMDLCYVAAGRYDGFWELGLHPWDTAAAILIIREAGGRVTDFEGAELDLVYEKIVASNGLLHGAMLSTVK